MSKTGDYNVLMRRRERIAQSCKPCPVCGRPVAFKTTPPPSHPRHKLIKSQACSTSCMVELKHRMAREVAKESSHV